MKPSKKKKPNQTRWEWHYNNFTSSLHLVAFCQLCFVFVTLNLFVFVTLNLFVFVTLNLFVCVTLNFFVFVTLNFLVFVTLNLFVFVTLNLFVCVTLNLDPRKIRSSPPPSRNKYFSEQPWNIWTYPEKLFSLPCVQVYHRTKLESHLFNLYRLRVDVHFKSWCGICTCATMPEVTTVSGIQFGSVEIAEKMRLSN